MKQILERYAAALSEHVKNTPFTICELGSKFARGLVGRYVSNRETKALPFEDNRAPYTYLVEATPYHSTQYDKTRRSYEFEYSLKWIAVFAKDSEHTPNDVVDSMVILFDSFHFSDDIVTEYEATIDEITTSYEDIYFDQLDAMPTTANVQLAELAISVRFVVTQCHVRSLPIIGQCITQQPTYAPETVAFMAAMGLTDATIAGAVDALVLGLQNASLWGKFFALYPFVGSTIDTVKYNLINPQNTDSAFRLNLVGGWQIDANGLVGNGVNTYADTFFTPSVHNVAGLNDTHISIYSRTANTGNGVDFGAYSRQPFTGAIIDALNFTLHYGGRMYLGANSANTDAGAFVAPTTGLYILNRRNSINAELYRRGTILYTTALSSQLLCNENLLIGARNDNGITMYSTNRQYAFASIGTGLTPTECQTFTTLVDAFQNALNRSY